MRPSLTFIFSDHHIEAKRNFKFVDLMSHLSKDYAKTLLKNKDSDYRSLSYRIEFTNSQGITFKFQSVRMQLKTDVHNASELLGELPNDIPEYGSMLIIWPEMKSPYGSIDKYIEPDEVFSLLKNNLPPLVRDALFDYCRNAASFRLNESRNAQYNATGIISLLDKMTEFLVKSRASMLADFASVIGPFRLFSENEIKMVKELGEGGFGKVLLATFNNSPVAVKTLKPAYPQSAKDALKQEAAVLSKHRAPNLVQMFGILNKDNTVSIVMEYMPGGSLRNFIDARQFIPVDWARQGYSLALGIVSGLMYLHSQNVAHRDLKSHNILLNETQTQAKLCDFGLSKIVEAGASTQSSVSFAGTIGWMAPEIFQGKEPIKASDIYAFAIVLWEMAARKVPWDGFNLFAIMLKVQNGERPVIPDDTPVSIKNCISQCWFADPNARMKLSDISTLLVSAQNAPPVLQNASANVDQMPLDAERYVDFATQF